MGLFKSTKEEAMGGLFVPHEFGPQGDPRIRFGVQAFRVNRRAFDPDIRPSWARTIPNDHKWHDKIPISGAFRLTEYQGFQRGRDAFQGDWIVCHPDGLLKAYADREFREIFRPMTQEERHLLELFFWPVKQEPTHRIATMAKEDHDDLMNLAGTVEDAKSALRKLNNQELMATYAAQISALRVFFDFPAIRDMTHNTAPGFIEGTTELITMAVANAQNADFDTKFDSFYREMKRMGVAAGGEDQRRKMRLAYAKSLEVGNKRT